MTEVHRLSFTSRFISRRMRAVLLFDSSLRNMVPQMRRSVPAAYFQCNAIPASFIAVSLIQRIFKSRRKQRVSRKNPGRRYVVIRILVILSKIKLWRYASLTGIKKKVAVPTYGTKGAKRNCASPFTRCLLKNISYTAQRIQNTRNAPPEIQYNRIAMINPQAARIACRFGAKRINRCIADKLKISASVILKGK